MNHNNINSKTKVSVIIPSYNSAKTIKYSIDSLLKQTANENIVERIVVDSSEDSITIDLLNSFANEGKIIHINSGFRIMPAIQRNIGAKSASGDVLLFLDSDAFPANNWVENILKYYEKGWYAGGGSYAIPDFQQDNKLAKAQYYLEFNEYIDSGKPRIKKILPSCNLFCDKKLFEDVGGFPEIRASEDSLFGLKISKVKPMIFIPEAKVTHIFRENEEHYYNNQVLLGKYIFVYRKMHYNSFYYNGLWPFFLYPFFISFKFLRIYFRIIKAGKKHFIEYHKSLSYFFKGLNKWGQGFLSGIAEENK